MTNRFKKTLDIDLDVEHTSTDPKVLILFDDYRAHESEFWWQVKSMNGDPKGDSIGNDPAHSMVRRYHLSILDGGGQPTNNP